MAAERSFIAIKPDGVQRGLVGEILVLLLKGLSDVAFADALGISIHTVKDYGKSIRVKYNVKTRVQLISALLGRALQTSR